MLADLNVRDNLKFFAALCHGDIPEEPFLPLEAAGKKRVGKLSGGMQKRLSLVCAALGEPDILLLDEPCIGLDVAAQELLFRQITRWKEQGRCILYAGHNAAERNYHAFVNKVAVSADSCLGLALRILEIKREFESVYTACRVDFVNCKLSTVSYGFTVYCVVTGKSTDAADEKRNVAVFVCDRVGNFVALLSAPRESGCRNQYNEKN